MKQPVVVISYRRFGTTYRLHLQGTRIKETKESAGFLETLVWNWHYSLRNNPRQPNFHHHCYFSSRLAILKRVYTSRFILSLWELVSLPLPRSTYINIHTHIYVDTQKHIVKLDISFMFNKNYVQLHSFHEDRGSTMVKVLCYKLEVRWFDPSWCHWNFSLT